MIICEDDRFVIPEKYLKMSVEELDREIEKMDAEIQKEREARGPLPEESKYIKMFFK